MDGVELSGKLTFEGPERQPKIRIEAAPNNTRNKAHLPMKVSLGNWVDNCKGFKVHSSSSTAFVRVLVCSVEARGPSLAGLTGEVYHGQTIVCNVDNPDQNR